MTKHDLVLEGMKSLIDKQYEQAIHCFTKAISLDADDVSIYMQRGGVYMLAQQFESAIRDFSQVISLRPNVGKFYTARGACYLQLGNTEKALADFLKGSELGDERADGYLKELATREPSDDANKDLSPHTETEKDAAALEERAQYRVLDFMRTNQIYVHTLAQEMPRYAMPMHLAKRFFDNFVGEVFRFDGITRSIIIWTAKYDLPKFSWADGYLYSQTLEEMDAAGWQNKPDPVARIYFACGGGLAKRIEVSDMRKA
jgi:tetratricopeptide (TPR) repeat protein